MTTSQSTESAAPIGMLDLAAERASLGQQLNDRVQAVLNSGQYVLGPEVQGFEEEFAAFQRSTHAVGVASGTDALIVALRAAGVGPGDLVATSPFTFFASAASIAWVGARPILVDVDRETALMTPEATREAIDCWGGRVKAILPVHLYGQLVDMRGFRALADELGCALIEDAAQAHGAERDGVRAGEIGDLACFSFYPTKNLGAAGEGGAVLTPSAEWDQRLRRLRDHGSPVKYQHTELGTNTRLAALQAAVLRVKLPHLEEWNRLRRERAQRYDQAFAGSARIKPLKVASGSQPVYHQYTVCLPPPLDRSRVASDLAEAGVSSAVHYPTPVHLQPAAAPWGYSPGDLPAAEALAKQVLCLPIHPFLALEDVDRVAEALLRATD
ncbi:MAG: DegT/DnrJ/EryC1/StrS family aminotransferase [Myxococcota bacterium]